MATTLGKRPPNFILYNPGDKIGNLIYISEAESIPKRRKINVKCACGDTFTTDVKSCRRKDSRRVISCGCMNIKRGPTTKEFNHPKYPKEYSSWCSMKGRCLNVNDPAYHNYGGRGIKVCDHWVNSFENFYLDMGCKPSKDYSIERDDVNGNYEPTNCRWATNIEQQNNKRTNIVLHFDGRSMSIAMWAKELGLNHATIRRRIKRGWDHSKALLTEVASFKYQSKLTYPWIKAI